LKHLEEELTIAKQKTIKYKKISKTFKSNLDNFESTLSNLKKMSQRGGENSSTECEIFGKGIEL
jgi:hypothetical protein